MFVDEEESYDAQPGEVFDGLNVEDGEEGKEHVAGEGGLMSPAGSNGPDHAGTS